MFEEDKLITYFEKNYRENLDTNDFSLSKGQGCIVKGPVGSRKTHKLIERLLKEDNPRVLSFTNKAIQNVKERSIIGLREHERDTNFMEDEINHICKTFDGHFCEWKDSNIKNIKDKTVLIDEYSMVPNKFMTILYK